MKSARKLTCKVVFPEIWFNDNFSYHFSFSESSWESGLARVVSGYQRGIYGCM